MKNKDVNHFSNILNSFNKTLSIRSKIRNKFWNSLFLTREWFSNFLNVLIDRDIYGIGIVHEIRK